MGLFDSALFSCEVCGHEVEAQSKSGGCFLDRYSIDSVPYNIAKDLIGRVYAFPCQQCGTAYQLKLDDRSERVKLIPVKIA